MTLLVQEGNNMEEFLLKDCTVSEPIFIDNSELNIVQTIIKFQLEGGNTDKWNKIDNTCMGVSKETSTGVHHMYTMEKKVTGHQR